MPDMNNHTIEGLEQGYYWVKRPGMAWEIARYQTEGEVCWFVTGEEFAYGSMDFQVIDKKRISYHG